MDLYSAAFVKAYYKGVKTAQEICGNLKHKYRTLTFLCSLEEP